MNQVLRKKVFLNIFQGPLDEFLKNFAGIASLFQKIFLRRA
jgi:hypothetical protein